MSEATMHHVRTVAIIILCIIHVDVCDSSGGWCDIAADPCVTVATTIGSVTITRTVRRSSGSGSFSHYSI